MESLETIIIVDLRKIFEVDRKPEQYPYQEELLC